MEENEKIFSIRLMIAMKERGESQSSLSQKMGIQRQTLSQYMLGKTKPNTDVLAALCRVLQVSADYLLGLSEVKSTDPSLQAAAEYTGLSEKAVAYLHEDFSEERYSVAGVDYLLNGDPVLLNAIFGSIVMAISVAGQSDSAADPPPTFAREHGTITSVTLSPSEAVDYWAYEAGSNLQFLVTETAKRHRDFMTKAREAAKRIHDPSATGQGE